MYYCSMVDGNDISEWGNKSRGVSVVACATRLVQISGCGCPARPLSLARVNNEAGMAVLTKSRKARREQTCVILQPAIYFS